LSIFACKNLQKGYFYHEMVKRLYTKGQNRGRKKGARNRVFSISAAAKLLKVDVSHLFRVVRGERVNPGLLARYFALKRSRCGMEVAIRDLSNICPDPKASRKIL
jgi:hypothetical protein